MFAEVIVDINHTEVDKVFDYGIEIPNVQIGSRVIVPFGKKMYEGIVVGLKENSEVPLNRIKTVQAVLEETPALTPETLSLSNFVCKSCFVTRAQALRLFLPVEMRKGRVKEKYKTFVGLKDGIDLESVLSSLKKSAVKQREFLLYLSENGKSGLTEMNAKFGASAVKGAENKGITQLFYEQNFRSPYKDLENKYRQVNLTQAQKDAIESIERTNKSTTLLFGVTGSGKTEVYLGLIDDVIKEGKTAIMLVPEIALTPQMLRQLRARFGEKAAILHSGLSAGERFDEWWRLRSGEAKIAIGARSAVFAPLENLGLIIIDEEHDGSYTSESSPRYSTVDVATERIRYYNGKLVLGSATPSLESFYKAENGEYNLVELPERINKKPLPTVEIADMRLEVRRGNNTMFSSLLKHELEKCLNLHNQAILFLNQRGYSKNVICAECGHVIKCGNCDVSLTYHREDESLLCHYCGAKYKMVDACPECGSKFIRYGGTGTERIVSELKKLFPEAKILRMDRDTTQNKEGHFKILSEFSERKADILVGTQMIAKGHDFPFVTLVGILDADQSLHFSDFRSGERTYQLLTQVAGRSGRANEAGKVVLQTYSPDNNVLAYAIKYDYLGLYKHELSIRKATSFPPFSDIVRLLISGEKEEDVVEVTKVLYSELGDIYNKNKEKFGFFGCMKAPIKRLQNKFRYQILMRIKPEGKELINTVFCAGKVFNNGNITVNLEVNPSNLS